jgi:hypothetical protein
MTTDSTILAAAAKLKADIAKSGNDLALIAATANSIKADLGVSSDDLDALMALVPDPAPPPPPPASSDIVLPAWPGGVPVPKDGGKLVAGDAFNAKYPISDMWFKNRGIQVNGKAYPEAGPTPGFNSDEAGKFQADHATLNTTAGHGLILTAECVSATPKQGAYISACLNSDNFGQPNPLLWRPRVGQLLVINTRIRLAPMPGADFGCWRDVFYNTPKGKPAGKSEWDGFEQMNDSSGGGGGEMICNWFGYDVNGNAFGAGREYYPKDQPTKADLAHDGQVHEYSFVFDGIASNTTFSVYVDEHLGGNWEDQYNKWKVGPASFPWPAGANNDIWGGLTLSFAVRGLASGEVAPPWKVGNTDFVEVEHVGWYLNGSADVTQSIQGAKLAPGTAVAASS